MKSEALWNLSFNQTRFFDNTTSILDPPSNAAAVFLSGAAAVAVSSEPFNYMQAWSYEPKCKLGPCPLELFRFEIWSMHRVYMPRNAPYHDAFHTH